MSGFELGHHMARCRRCLGARRPRASLADRLRLGVLFIRRSEHSAGVLVCQRETLAAQCQVMLQAKVANRSTFVHWLWWVFLEGA
jgi:hypothetical protein